MWPWKKFKQYERLIAAQAETIRLVQEGRDLERSIQASRAAQTVAQLDEAIAMLKPTIGDAMKSDPTLKPINAWIN